MQGGPKSRLSHYHIIPVVSGRLRKLWIPLLNHPCLLNSCEIILLGFKLKEQHFITSHSVMHRLLNTDLASLTGFNRIQKVMVYCFGQPCIPPFYERIFSK